MSKEIIKQIPLTVLDLVPALEGQTARKGIQNSLELAQHVENLGFYRFWISEHHNTRSLLSSATAILMGYIAQGTQKIRIGSGGIMLPNHAPLIVAEQMGTLATVYPERTDIRHGIVAGSNQYTHKALRIVRIEIMHD